MLTGSQSGNDVMAVMVLTCYLGRLLATRTVWRCSSTGTLVASSRVKMLTRKLNRTRVGGTDGS